MNKLKKYNFILKFLLFIISLTFTLTLLNIIFNLSITTSKIISFIGIISYSLIIGFKTGKNCEKEAYKEGTKKGLINILILYVLSCLTLNFKLPLKKIIYYLIILISTILGSIIGINKKRSK